MSRTSLKPARSLDEQVALLRERGLVVRDAAVARSALLNWNYYRLSGYFRQFQVDPRGGDDRFHPGVTFEDVIAARHYDVAFASVLLDGALEVERVVRSRFAHHLAMRHGSTAFYLDPDAYLPVMAGRGAFVGTIAAELARNRHATVRRYAVGDDLSGVPVWVGIEQLSFGVVSRMLTYLADTAAAREVAASLSLPWGTFPGTIHGLSYGRNLCAHHGQLWHRWMSVQTPLHKKERRLWDRFDPQGPVPTALGVLRVLRAVDRRCARADRLEGFLRAPSVHRAGLFQPGPR